MSDLAENLTFSPLPPTPQARLGEQQPVRHEVASVKTIGKSQFPNAIFLKLLRIPTFFLKL
ncbi:hypothetical protein Krac_10724 [Ktedonobacter racemifer DSM 44963]|uniref:Uncharacterized protein n=1 Tax=Ktedonobacter racemifer DSM 44963 TaxID=485913 RepID=D6TIC5_KTERA|nr:hypothetical protein Krac_10724 [Ktedonobacter racemifer DSM 44963]